MNAAIRSLAVAAVTLAALPTPAAGADSLRCAGGLVSAGDARLDLLARCGPPDLRDRRVDERWTIAGKEGAAVGRRVSVVVEEWSYDFGPNAFTCLVRLENGRIVAMERGTYGRRREPPAERLRPARASCEENAVREGDGKLDVLSRCGEPAALDAWDEAVGELVTDGTGFAAGAGRTTRVERWTYDFGRNRFVRFVRIENGRVVKVSTGSYGYAD
jgi:hypothetical protein